MIGFSKGAVTQPLWPARIAASRRLTPNVIELRDFDFSSLASLGSRRKGEPVGSVICRYTPFACLILFLGRCRLEKVWERAGRFLLLPESLFPLLLCEKERKEPLLPVGDLSTCAGLVFLCSSMFYVLGPNRADFSDAWKANYNFLERNSNVSGANYNILGANSNFLGAAVHRPAGPGIEANILGAGVGKSRPAGEQGLLALGLAGTDALSPAPVQGKERGQL